MKKILVANRGEIALRVMRSAKEMHISTVAVYSEADRELPFVKYADEAICIGEGPSSTSYLDQDKILNACKESGADALHPGYGFLSENAGFADRVEKAGITFIGPSSHAIEVMGSKLQAKATVKDYNIPMIPGTDEAIEDESLALKTACEIGFPVLIKASAGGGGKGMRIVEKEGEFIEQLGRAISEAQSAFGDGSVFIERYVKSPKHIEIQVLADKHDNVVYLFERDCSVQRRHQKVVEEAPSAVLSEELRKEMGEAAVNVARSCGYVGAGTVEFLLDDQHRFYFLEMNTRLQVEHPVTEQITGKDLVKEQIKVARGEKLDFGQEDLKIQGHSFEVRVYAEDPANNFLPDIGRLKTYRRPQGLGIRVDDGYEEGLDIPIYYDPMISKLVTFGKDREEARQRMLRAIDDYVINGIKTTLPFCNFVLNHKAFIDGKFDTNFVSEHFEPEKMQPNTDRLEEAAAIFASAIFNKEKNQAVAKGYSNNHSTSKESAWKKRYKV